MMTLWHFAKGMVSTREKIQNFATLVDISCPLHSISPKNDLYIMAQCEVSYVLWFYLLSLYLQNISFFNPLDFLAIVTHANKKLGILEF